jgi:hypothetical protein
MFLEEVEVKAGDTIASLAADYGYHLGTWIKVWNHPKNAALVALRKTPERLQVGDRVMIPIPWKVNAKTLVAVARGATINVDRDGDRGKALSWVQTVYRHNQPIGPNPNPFCVDGCTPDDDLPFYWTDAEIAASPNLRTHFSDTPSRNAPSVAMGITKWRAIVSIAAVTKKRVTVWDSLVWGFDMTPAGVVTTVGPRKATAHEVAGHLNLLKNGVGTSGVKFTDQGWRFRAAP